MKGPLKNDLAAGLTVTLVGIPQCLAYAIMAGLPPAYGLATAAVAGLVCAALQQTVSLVAGPTNATGLLVLAALTPYLDETGIIAPAALAVVATLTLLAGVLRGVAVLLRLDRLVMFLPDAVLSGFLTGAGVLIGAMQIDEAIGLPPIRGTGLVAELSGLQGLFAQGVTPAGGAVFITFATAAVLYFGQKRASRVPLALIVTVLATVVAWLIADTSWAVAVVQDRAAVPSAWPPTALPTFELDVLKQLALPAVAIVLVGTMELAVTVRAERDDVRLSRDTLAFGAANAVAAFLGGFPASASLTRSALLRMSGAKTRWAAATVGLLTIPVLFLGPLVGLIPHAALAGVLFVVAFRMIDLDRLRAIYEESRLSRIVMIATIAATLILPLEWAAVSGGVLAVIHRYFASKTNVRAISE